MAKEPNKCAHDGCSCNVPDGEKYCSMTCERAKDVTTIACECGHPECKSAVLAT